MRDDSLGIYGWCGLCRHFSLFPHDCSGQDIPAEDKEGAGVNSSIANHLSWPSRSSDYRSMQKYWDLQVIVAAQFVSSAPLPSRWCAVIAKANVNNSNEAFTGPPGPDGRKSGT